MDIPLYRLDSNIWNSAQKEGEMDLSVVPDTKVGVLDKAMRILHTFPTGDTALTPQQIACSTGMPVPTVYRLFQVLSEHGWLMKEGQQYRLGMALLHLGAKVAS